VLLSYVSGRGELTHGRTTSGSEYPDRNSRKEVEKEGVKGLVKPKTGAVGQM